MNYNDSCITGLYESKILGNSLEQVKKICNDYKFIKDYNVPVKYIFPSQQSDTVKVNSDGFRGGEIGDKTGYRIFFTGGSTAYGLYATSDNKTIPGILDELISIDIEVINAGVNGANSFDEKYIILNKIMKFQPDMIISYTGWNDLANDIKTEYKKTSVVDEYNIFVEYLKKYFKTFSLIEYLDRVIVKQLNEENLSDLMSFDTQDTKMKIQLWKERWIEICSENNKNNIKTVLIIQPLIDTGNKQFTIWEEKILGDISNQSPSKEYPKLLEASEELKQYCTLVEDFSKIFSENDELIFYDIGHMSDRGNEIIAKELSKIILPLI